MNTIRLTIVMTAITALVPATLMAAPEEPDGNQPPPPMNDHRPPPPRPTCTYQDHTCYISSPDLNFVVTKINDIVPSSSNDCKLLPPCGNHFPPPPPPPREDNGGPNDNGGPGGN